MKIPSVTKRIEFNGKSFDLNYPKIDGLINMEVNKINYSKGSYSQMNKLQSLSGMFAKYSVDMIATIEVVCPDIFKKVDIFEWELSEVKQLLSLYLKEILPWMNEWQQFLDADPSDIKDEE